MSSIAWKARPTRHELLKLKSRLELAKRAHDLLENKYKMINSEAQKVKETLSPFEKSLRADLDNAGVLFMKATMNSGVRVVEMAAAFATPNDDVEVDWERLHGLSVPRLRSRIQVRDPLSRGYGILGTTPAIDDAARAYESAMNTLVTVAELRNMYQILEGEVERTRIRVFALEKVLIPYLEMEIDKIEMKLEERERERYTSWKWYEENSQSSLVPR